MTKLIDNDDIILKQDTQLEQIYLLAVELCDEYMEVARVDLLHQSRERYGVPQGSFGKCIRILIETEELVPVVACTPTYKVGSLRADGRIPEL